METKTYRNLRAGDFPVVTESMVILTGEVITEGTVLGKITASGKGVIVNSAGTDDGRRTAYAVLLQDVDATSADVTAPVALCGEFNENKLIFGGTDTVETHRATLRGLSIYPKKYVDVDGVHG